jgi:hypothetical protein
MLRNRATYGEYQPKSFAGGHKKGVPNGPPISGYYPAAIDKGTFEAAQVARRHNLANRGRKGKNVANIFSGLTSCAYCGSDVIFHRISNVQILVCERVLEDRSCSRTAWTYEDFEKAVFSFLVHPALAELSQGKQLEQLAEFSKEIASLSSNEERHYSTRVNISVLLRQIVSNLIVHSAGVITSPRHSSAQITKDITGRYLEIRLGDGRVYKCISVA